MPTDYTTTTTTRKMIAHGISCTPRFLFVKGNQVLLKYLGFESLTGQAKHNQMTKLEQLFGHGMILDILEYGI